MAFPWSAVIGAGSSLLGGLFDRSREDDQLDFQRESFGHSLAFEREKEAAARARYEREFALTKGRFAEDDFRVRNYIAMRTEDARNAGVHPLFALGGGLSGAGGSSPSFSGGGGSPSMPAGYGGTGSAVGDAIRGIGGAFGRAAEERRLRQASKDNRRLVNAQIRRFEAETSLVEDQLLASRTKRLQETALVRRASPVVARTLAGNPKGVKPAKRGVEVRPHVDQAPVGVAVLPDGTAVPWVNEESGLADLGPGAGINLMYLMGHGARKAGRHAKRWVKSRHARGRFKRYLKRRFGRGPQESETYP